MSNLYIIEKQYFKRIIYSYSKIKINYQNLVSEE